jgi:UDP-glucose 4-epimerase
MVERFLDDFDRTQKLRSVSLRYFNAAGADPDGQIGERHQPETHLIPLVLMAASGRRDSIGIFGDDYDTPDGTCVRDYIHILDLCEAHLLALKYLAGGGSTAKFNLGNGHGFSIYEVISAVEAATGRRIRSVVSERRAGDPARLVADSSLARTILGWQPNYADLQSIVTHAWKWEQKMATLECRNGT